MILALKGLVAHCAQVLPLVAVGQPMLGQRGRVAEHLVAEAALLGAGLVHLKAVGGERRVVGCRLALGHVAAQQTIVIQKSCDFRYHAGGERGGGEQGGGARRGGRVRGIRLHVEQNIVELTHVGLEGGV